MTSSRCRPHRPHRRNRSPSSWTRSSRARPTSRTPPPQSIRAWKPPPLECYFKSGTQARVRSLGEVALGPPAAGARECLGFLPQNHHRSRSGLHAITQPAMLDPGPSALLEGHARRLFGERGGELAGLPADDRGHDVARVRAVVGCDVHRARQDEPRGPLRRPDAEPSRRDRRDEHRALRRHELAARQRWHDARAHDRDVRHEDGTFRSTPTSSSTPQTSSSPPPTQSPPAATTSAASSPTSPATSSASPTRSIRQPRCSRATPPAPSHSARSRKTTPTASAPSTRRAAAARARRPPPRAAAHSPPSPRSPPSRSYVDVAALREDVGAQKRKKGPKLRSAVSNPRFSLGALGVLAAKLLLRRSRGSGSRSRSARTAADLAPSCRPSGRGRCASARTRRACDRPCSR